MDRAQNYECNHQDLAVFRSYGMQDGNMLISLVLYFIIIAVSAILIIPLRLSLFISKNGATIQGSIHLGWSGLTLVRKEIAPQSAGELLAGMSKGEVNQEASQADSQAENEKGRGAANAAEKSSSISLSSLLNAAFALKDMLLYLFHTIRIRNASARLCFGLDDPADTAIMCGHLFSLAAIFGLIPGRVFIDPWFGGEHLEGEMAIEMEIRLMWVAWAFIWALRAKEIRQLLMEAAGWI